MASKKPQSKVDPSQIPVQPGVDAEAAFLAAQSTQTDKEWMDQTAQVWAERQAAEKDAKVAKADGQAVINLADASGVVGQQAGASLIVADASDSNNTKVAVKDKEEKSDDKGGYIWGGLGLLGLVGIAAAASGGGGGGGSSPAPLRLDGLVIDDPVANAVVFRDFYNDGYLHVVAVDGGYVIDPNQSVVMTDENGQFSNLGGSGRIISVGINRLPIKIYEPDLSGVDTIDNTEDDLTLTQAIIEDSFENDQHASVTVATVGDLLFKNLSNADNEVSINDGEYAYIVGENQIFDSMIISSGITLSVSGANVNLVTGVTALVDAYLNNPDNNLDASDEDDVKTAIINVATMFGFDLSEGSTDTELMSFLLGGYDVAGIESAGNLNQEIFSVINSLQFSIEALDNEFTVEDQLVTFQAALSAILWAQSERGEDEDLTTFATNLDALDEIIEAFTQLADEFDLIDYSDRQLVIDVARNHGNLGGGAADIYESVEENDNLVNLVEDGTQLTDDDVNVVGNITVVAGHFDVVDLDLDHGVELMGSNILVSAYGEDSWACLDLEAQSATGSLMSNGTYTYDAESETIVPIGDITIQAAGNSSEAYLELSGDISISGTILVETKGDNSVASLDSDYSWNSSIDYDHADIVVKAFGSDSDAIIDANSGYYTGEIDSIHVIANSNAYNMENVGSYAEASADIDLTGTLGNVTVEAVAYGDDADLEIDANQDANTPKMHFYDISNMQVAGFNGMQIGDVVTLRIGLKALTATLTSQDFEGDLIDNIVNKLKLDSDYDALNIDIKRAGWGDGWYGGDVNGIVVRWLEAGNNDISRLLLNQEEVEMTTGIEDDNDYNGEFITMNSSVITLNAHANTDAIFDITEAVGTISEVHVNALGQSADADADLSLNGLLGDVFVKADGENAWAGVEMNNSPGYLRYDNSVINVQALGEDADAEFIQESYATGNIESILVETIGNSYFGEDGANADMVIGGDITINTDVSVYARATEIDNDNDYWKQVRSNLSLGNNSTDFSTNTTIDMDGVDISVESYGHQSMSTLSTSQRGDNNDIETVVTGTINTLNVVASGFDEDLTDISPVLVADAYASVDLNMHGVIESINLTADHVSTVDVYLSGDIDTSDLMSIEVSNSNSSYVDLYMNNVNGDISLLDVHTSEDASSDIFINLNGSIETANFTTTTNASLDVDLNLNGSGNVIEELNIATLATSNNVDYTTEAVVKIAQDSHGGVVNIFNGTTEDNYYSDTRLIYNSDYQADRINLFGLSPREINSNLLTNLQPENFISEFTVTYPVGNSTNTQTYAAGNTADIPGIGTLTIDRNGDYSFTSIDGWTGLTPQVTYLVHDGDLETSAVEETLDLTPTLNDGENDYFNLSINMTDVDVYGVTHGTQLLNNMTTLTGFTGNTYTDDVSADLTQNNVNNTIQFAEIDDDDYIYEPSVTNGNDSDLSFNISHYSNGLAGWLGGNTAYFDDVEGSRNIGDGYYGSMDEFFNAAQFGIASEYAFIDLNYIQGAGTSNLDYDNFETDLTLVINYVDEIGIDRTVYLDWMNLSTNFGANQYLLNEITVSDIVSNFNSDINWDDNETDPTNENGNGYAWSNYDDNVTLFDNGNGLLGIRIGEGSFTNVTFNSSYSFTDNPGELEDDDELNQIGTSTAQDDKLAYSSIGKAIDFDADNVGFVEGGGYFFGMVLNDPAAENPTYRGILAMDEDGEGVTKLIELADVIAPKSEVDEGSEGGYDNFSSAYIGHAYLDSMSNMSVFDYDDGAGNYLIDIAGIA